MTTYHWIGGTGSYGTASNWSPTPLYYPGYGLVSDSVVFDGTSAYTVTISGAYGDLAGFTLTDPNATIVFSGEGVPLEASAFSMSAGTIDIQFGPSMPGGGVDLFTSQTLTGGTINFSGDSGINFQDSDSASVTTFGAGLTINLVQGTDFIGYGYGYAGDQLINQGTINAASANGATFSIETNEENAGLVNQGRLNAGGNSSLSVQGWNIQNNGTISVTGTSKFTAAFYSFTNNGTISVQSNVGFVAAEFALNTPESLINNGTITANGGYVDFTDGGFNGDYAAVSGSGSIDILNGGTVRSYGGSFLNQDVTFQGAGKLIVLSSVPKPVFGFSAGDSIDYALISYAAGDRIVWQGTKNGVQTFALLDSYNNSLTTVNFAGSYSAASFQVSNDGSGGALITYARTTPPSPAPDDFNGDGVSDILWRNANGEVYVWNSTTGPSGFTGQDLGNVDTSWQVASVGDFNDDGRADILWRNANGEVYTWISTSSGGFTHQDLGNVDTSWQIASVGDFNGDGLSDILWRNANGEVYLWDSTTGPSGFTHQDLGNVATSWQIAGVGDFNGDGRSDILWHNANGEVYLWDSTSSGGFTHQDLGNVATSWQIAGVGDFNGDGRSDILWHNANGEVYLWDSTSSGGFTHQDLGNVATSWQIAAVGDFNGGGLSDILWRNANGEVYVWDSTSAGGFTHQDLGNVATSWSIQK